VARPGGLQWGVVAGVWGLKLKSFEPSEDRGSGQLLLQHPLGKGVCVAIAVIRVSQLQGQGLGPEGCRAATYKVKLSILLINVNG